MGSSRLESSSCVDFSVLFCLKQHTHTMVGIETNTALFVIIFLLSKYSLGSTAKLSTDERLIPLNSLTSHLNQGENIILHHDPSLSPDMMQEVMALPGMRNVLRMFMTYKHNCSTYIYTGKQINIKLKHILGTSRTVHILILLSYEPKLLELLCTSWSPKQLVLYSLARVNITNVLSDLALATVEKVVLITEEYGKKHKLVVYTLFPFSAKGPKFLGEWSPRYFNDLETLLVNRYPTFEGHKFEVASWVGEMPFVYRKHPSEMVQGVSVELLNCLASVLNFTYTLMEKPPDSKFGNRNNGSWDGLLGMIQRWEKEFSINNLYLSAERAIYFDASVPCWQDGYGIFLLKPKPLPKWMSVYRTFTHTVWGFTVAFLAVATAFLYVQARASGNSLLVDAVAVWLFLTRAMLSQGAPDNTRSLSLRIFLAVWFTSCLVLTTAYTSKLISLLTRPTYSGHIHSLQELAESNFRLTTLNYGGHLQVMLAKSADPVVKTLSKRMDLVLEKSDMVDLMLGGRHGVVVGSRYGHSLLAFTYKLDNWYTVKEWLFPSYASWFFAKNTPWKNRFNKYITYLNEGGLIDYWYNMEIRSLGRRNHGQDLHQNVISLTLNHLQGSFYLLCIGWASGVVVLLLENMVIKSNVSFVTGIGQRFGGHRF